MATFNIGPIVMSRLEGLESIPIFHATEDPSETWKQGALLVFNATNGRLAECAADPTVVQGVAMVAASGVTGRDVPAIRPLPEVIFEATLENAGYALVQTDLGKQYGAAKDGTSGFWYVDQAETTVKVFEIVGFVSDIGDIRARVLVKFTQAAQE